MNTSQLQSVLFREHIHGTVCAIDQLPTHIDHFPSAFIINTDEHDEPGEHWVAVYFPESTKAEFFDSYGHLPSYFDERLVYFLQKANSVIYNTVKLQGPLTPVCGQYCLFYIMHRERGIPADILLTHLNMFNTDTMVQLCLNQHLNT